MASPRGCDIVQYANIGVGQRGDRLGFAFQPPCELWIPEQRFAQNLDGDGATELRVLSLVHLAHAARAQRRSDRKSSELAPWRQVHEVTASSFAQFQID
jgi:hypothetical protein